MLPVFDFLKSLVRLRTITIDNSVFQLHYRWTVAVLLAFSVLVNLKQYFGDAIACRTEFEEHNKKAVENYCWIQTTFTIPSSYNLTVGVHGPYPGVINTKGDMSSVKYHAYYQWVGLTLFFQAVIFSIPRFIWKAEEGGLMKDLVSGLSITVLKQEDKIMTKQLLLYLKNTMGTHGGYVAKYIVCEMANFVNVVLQIVLMEKFLEGAFSAYGLQAIGVIGNAFKHNSLMYPGFWIFPRMTKCLFHDFGSGGSVQKHDIYCLLPLNIIHEKIFVVLFLWFLMLAIVSGVVVVLRFVSLLMLEYRQTTLASHAPYCSQPTVQRICQKYSFSDWFFLKLVLKNISPMHSKILLTGIVEELQDNGLQSGGFMEKIGSETALHETGF